MEDGLDQEYDDRRTQLMEAYVVSKRNETECAACRRLLRLVIITITAAVVVAITRLVEI